MLAGTVYFYDEKEKMIKEIDLEEYDALSESEFTQMLKDLGASKVTMDAVSHNHHSGKETVLYEKIKKSDRYNK